MSKKRNDSLKTSLISTRFLPKKQIKSKKAQITIFIILGIVILIAVSLVILLKTELVTFKTGDIIPTEKGKVENYITTCIEKNGEDALTKIGLQGGYIDVQKDIANDKAQSLQTSPITVIPYWAYGENTRIPTLPEIKDRIDRYIEANVRTCLLQTQAFQESYDLIEKTSLSANTEIVESKILFNLHWDVEIRNKAGEVVTEVIDHVAESPIKLKKIHTLAQKIVEKEMTTLKLEDLTQDLIALEHPDVPVAGTELSCSKKTWNRKKVESTLKELLRINIGELKIKGTDFVQFPESLPYYQNHYVWDLGENYQNPKLNTVFNFDPIYPFLFAVTPLKDGSMQSSQLGGSDLISFLCIQSWKFTYDLVYPVEVRIQDETTGYNFHFAFTVHLVKNIPSRKDPIARPSTTLNTVTDQDYCTKRNIPITIKTSELVENDQGVSNKEYLDNVNISFTCLRYKCDLGTTESNFAEQGFAGITTNFPYCAGGILRATKGNYKESWERIVTTPGKVVELNLVPQLNFPLSKINVVKHQFIDQSHILPAQNLGNKETALIKLTLRKSTDPDALHPYHQVSLVKSKENDPLLEAEQNMQFLAKADFTYELEVMLFKQDQFTGGYKGNWTVSWDKLQNADQIIIHTLSKDQASEEESYTLMAGLQQNSIYLPVPEVK